ncbi:hypothetical protein CYMTET_51129 [Cymbomonas tetramitiformis]|uniref:Golgin-84 n=1 Tax=Cymbomonas tetramitiformis TaxID=36881 RepID=A0AAE0BLU2_9CHLO|nr:hypothetical protein CYMTET_51129 [Cymbomonas tetramitiformis]
MRGLSGAVDQTLGQQAQHCAAQALMENELRSELSAAVSGLSEDAGGLRAALQEAETSDTASASLDAAKEREEQEETELAEMRQRVAEQEAVVTQLEQQLVQRASKGSRGPSEAMRIGEMEDRLLSLKDQMAAKQLQAEQLTGDKRALELRLEQVEAQKRKIQRRSAKGSHDERRGSKTATTPRDHSSSPPKSNIELDDEKDRRGRQFVSARMARAAQSLDWLGLVAGSYLRSSSVLRLLAVVYVLFLHLIALIIIYTDLL